MVSFIVHLLSSYGWINKPYEAGGRAKHEPFLCRMFGLGTYISDFVDMDVILAALNNGHPARRILPEKHLGLGLRLDGALQINGVTQHGHGDAGGGDVGAV